MGLLAMGTTGLEPVTPSFVELVLSRLNWAPRRALLALVWKEVQAE
jgi:hypothetical protein